jgi:hypothetical protein
MRPDKERALSESILKTIQNIKKEKAKDIPVLDLRNKPKKSGG